MSKNVKKLYRSQENSILGGVCTGIAKYFQIDPVIVRIIAIFLALCAFSGVLFYFILWIIIPLEQNQKNNKTKKR